MAPTLLARVGEAAPLLIERAMTSRYTRGRARHRLAGGIVAIIVVFSVVGLIIIAGCLFCILKRLRRRRTRNQVLPVGGYGAAPPMDQYGVRPPPPAYKR